MNRDGGDASGVNDPAAAAAVMSVARAPGTELLGAVMPVSLMAA